ncbi:hypothetical protein PCANC_19699 [Puccinia coronata f. sp. avenae]|uniref:Uncharacterized protein n=1 Tax=Puccinia coronata f. sp. avenae TaxID=200324 RepID=A0A2N5SAX1_9BASI|nr:hypothetical protein PCANC_19699 [Puccinia coronata f. sp. avenae]
MPLATLPRWSEDARVFQQASSFLKIPPKSNVQSLTYYLQIPSKQERSSLAKEKNSTSLPVKPAACVNKTWPSPHLRLQPMQPHWCQMMAGLPMPVDVTGISESLALVNASADQAIPPTSQPSGNEDADMHVGTNLAVSASAPPEKTAMQDMDPQDDTG